MSDWGFGCFGGAVGVGDGDGAIGFHLEGDFWVVGGSVVVVFAQQAAVAGGVGGAVFSVMDVMHVAVDGFLVAPGQRQC